jgi:lipid-binding SYLF domain-containing protein
MKIKIIGFVLLALAITAVAIEPSELDNRIRTLTDKFDEFQHQPDKCIPDETLRKAKGIMLLDRTKAGFIFAYQGGGGVAMVKDAGLDKWSPAAFVDANSASLGLQIGGEQNFYVVLFMTTNSTRMLTDKKFEFGGEARGTAGGTSSGVDTRPPEQDSILIYDDRQGLYGGAAIKGGAVTPADEANHVYYGQYVSMSDILFDHKVQPTEASTSLAHKIQAFSQNPDAGTKSAQK